MKKLIPFLFVALASVAHADWKLNPYTQRQDYYEPKGPVGISTGVIQAQLDAHTIATSTHGATSANTASRIVMRDANGDFSASTITAASFLGPLTGNVIGNMTGNVTGNVTGNATTATTATNITGGAAGSIPYQTGAGATGMLATTTAGYVLTSGASAPAWVNGTSANTTGAFVRRDGSGNFTAGNITATLKGNADSATVVANLQGGSAGQLVYQSNANTTAMAPVGTAGYVLTGAGTSAPTWTQATSANTASAVVQRDASGNFAGATITATTFTGALNGNAATATTATTATTTSGNAATATKLATARNINGVAFDGSANINIATTSYLADGVSLALTGETFSAKSSSVTLQGNAFNGAGQLVKLDALGKLPAVDGSALLNLPETSGGAVLASTQTFTGVNTFGYGKLISPLETRTILIATGTGVYYSTNSSGGYMPRQLKIQMVGGGGAGGTANNPPACAAGTSGGNTSFGVVIASGGVYATSSYGVGGSYGNSTSSILRIKGGDGNNSGNNGRGGISFFGGPNRAGVGASSVNSNPNTGAGGSGAAWPTIVECGGGGAGEYVSFYINSPEASYSYSVGSGGVAASPGGCVGANGGSGIIIIEEFY